MKTKAQIWYTDFMIGILIFVIVIFIYYNYANNFTEDPSNVVADLMMEAKSISSSLMTPGSPSDWNKTNVDIIGITDGNQRLVQAKLDMFANMSYDASKTKLRTANDYYFYLEEIDGTRIQIDGKQGIGLSPNSSDNLIPITRIAVYNSRMVSMVVQVWD